MDLEQLAKERECASVQELIKEIGYDSVEQFWDYTAYIDDEGRLWDWTSGQDGDVCMFCEGDLSDVSEILLNDDMAWFQVAHTGCVEALRGDDIDSRDDNAMATGDYPPKRRFWRYAGAILVCAIVAIFTVLGIYHLLMC